MNTQKRLPVAFFIVASMVSALPAFAHVVVKPAQVGIGATQTFTVSVPNEKDVPTTAIRLLVPPGPKNLLPTTKPGWTIELKKTGTGDDAVVSEIIWTGGSIPAEQRDEFTFNAQVPATPSRLVWKAYQTYKGGEIVSWDADPNDPAAHNMEAMEKMDMGPYSITQVVDDLSGKNATPSAATATNTTPGTSLEPVSLTLATLALLLALVALIISIRRKK